MSKIHIVYGEQGAGKTTYAQQLADKEKATTFSIDEWMAELYTPDLPQPLDFTWIMERVKRCENRIGMIAIDIATNGGTVVLDLGFMKIEDRARFRSLARDNGLAVQLHFVTAARHLRRQRVLSRNNIKGETFSFGVSPQMFDFMETQFESPTSEESGLSIFVDTQENSMEGLTP